VQQSSSNCSLNCDSEKGDGERVEGGDERKERQRKMTSEKRAVRKET